ncbi:PucR family transcriptional regulator [Nocardiopsis flavescens]|uniref:PucR family transcriptional regulator n=1 Tax=Nocardiopsis flavescens TaxID=758803 RepID=UPI003665C622
MSITVRDIAAAPHLEVNTAAGFPGLDRVVRWAHVTELPDPVHWLRGGELVLTVGLGLDPDEEGRRAYVRRLHGAGCAGLAFAIDVWLRGAIPAEVLDEGDRLGFPVLRVEGETPFIAVVETVADHYAAERGREQGRVLAAQDAMARAALRSGPAGVMHELASATSGECLLLDRNGMTSRAVPGTERAWHGSVRAAVAGPARTPGMRILAGDGTSGTGGVGGTSRTGDAGGTGGVGGTGGGVPGARTTGAGRTGTGGTADTASGDRTGGGAGAVTGEAPGAGETAGAAAGPGTATGAGGTPATTGGRTGVGAGAAPVGGGSGAGESDGGGGTGAVLLQTLGTTGRTLGWLALRCDDPAASVRVLANHAASLLAVDLLHSRDARRAIFRERAPLLRAAALGGPAGVAPTLPPPPWEVVCYRLGRDADPAPGTPDALDAAADALVDVLGDTGAAQSAGLCPLDGVLVAVLPDTGRPHAGERLLALLPGVPAAGACRARGPGDLASAVSRARGAVPPHGYRHVDEADAWAILRSAVPESGSRAFTEAVLGPLLEHDARNGTELAHTLRHHLDGGGHVEGTARDLGVHRNTLRARLRTAERVLGRPLSDPRARLELWTALSLHPLRCTDGTWHD